MSDLLFGGEKSGRNWQYAGTKTPQIYILSFAHQHAYNHVVYNKYLHIF
jgi:hypothetical protein